MRRAYYFENQVQLDSSCRMWVIDTTYTEFSVPTSGTSSDLAGHTAE